MYPPIRTGTSFYSKNLAHNLALKGHNVKVITINGKVPNDHPSMFSVENIRGLKLPLRNYFKHLRVTSFSPSNYLSVNAILRNHKSDVVLLINHYLDIAFPAIVATRTNRIPLVCSVGTQLQSCNPFRNKILNFLDWLICGHFIFPFCHKIVAWDNEILRYLRDVHGNELIGKTAIVNYGVNGDIQAMMANEQDYSLHNQIVGVGAVSEQRDFVSLVQAFGIIAPEYPALRLKIIGHIYYDAAVRLAHDLGLKDRVVFTGELPHEAVLNEFKNSDAYFVSLTAKYVGLGTATIESMLMGVPVIANVPANLLGTTVVEDMKHLVLLNGLAPESTAAKMRTLLESRALREKIGNGGRSFIAKYMNWEKVSRDMEILLETVVKEYNSRNDR